jgi:hypothetical protein
MPQFPVKKLKSVAYHLWTMAIPNCFSEKPLSNSKNRDILFLYLFLDRDFSPRKIFAGKKRKNT